MLIEEFIARIDEAQRAYPSDAEDVLKKNAGKMVKALQENSPDSGHEGKHKIKNSWKKEIKGISAETLHAEIHSDSPHFHLLDRGHVMKTRSGKVIGFKQGLHFVKKTVNEEKAGLQAAMGAELYKKLKVKF